MNDKKEKCQELYRKLKNDMGDLESITFRCLWFERVQQLKEAGCWWHYSVLMRKAKDFKKRSVF